MEKLPSQGSYFLAFGSLGPWADVSQAKTYIVLPLALILGRQVWFLLKNQSWRKLLLMLWSEPSYLLIVI